ncbi:lipase member I-like [Hermetia illucens]|uniref:lipase member I-like n=1 Tax=Hermetia illucens TaxID=343691 RepID=UPI0018CC5F11|nr:lipase member I-like [Hermetia illucens]
MWWFLILISFSGIYADDLLPLEFNTEYLSSITYQDLIKDEALIRIKKPKLLFYYGIQSSYKYDFNESTVILTNPLFNNTMKTVIYIHGFLDGAFAESVKTVTRAYIERGDHNIIVVDWHADAIPGYFINAIFNMRKVGFSASTSILNMLNNGLNIDTLHLVGHSLGAQMAGIIGREIQRKTKGEKLIRRITALDPAYPGFYDVSLVDHVTKRDAEFVDVIHTDAGTFGAPYHTGTVDFWPNGGKTMQPGCDSLIFLVVDLCSHSRSWRYWAESVAGKFDKKFNAVRAKSWNDFKKGITEEFDPNVVIGIEMSFGLSGNYYLQTNFQSPFARGEAGIMYEKRLDMLSERVAPQ